MLGVATPLCFQLDCSHVIPTQHQTWEDCLEEGFFTHISPTPAGGHRVNQ